MSERLLVEFDYKGVEGVLVGYFARDADYIRITKLGHGVFSSHILGQPISIDAPDASVLCAALKRDHKRIYDAAKVINHLSNYGGTPQKIYEQYKKIFKNVEECRVLQELYFNTIARKVREWQRETIRVAHTRHWLQNPFGYRHYFWDVLTRLKGEVKFGTDAKRALAFLPQSTVAGVICEVLLRLGRATEACRLQIHDSLLFELLDDGFLNEKILFIKGEMERAVPELDGLVLPVEVKVGKNWGEMYEWSETKSSVGDAQQVHVPSSGVA